LSKQKNQVKPFYVLFLIFFLILSGLASCRKTCDPGKMISGTYAGKFIRWLGKTGPSSNVKITFNGSDFNGSSDSLNYPAICNGSFLTFGSDSIRFANQCAFPADFDWTLILNGSYKLILSGDSLYIRRVIGDFVYEEDVYSLARQ
jgi:hypothetical protein